MVIEISTDIHYSLLYCANFIERVTELGLKIGLLREIPALNNTLTYSKLYDTMDGAKPKYRACFPGYTEQTPSSWTAIPDYESLRQELTDERWRGKHSSNITFECNDDIEEEDDSYDENVVGWFVYTIDKSLLWVEEFETPKVINKDGDKVDLVVECLARCSTDI
jgi:hypothetical protein